MLALLSLWVSIGLGIIHAHNEIKAKGIQNYNGDYFYLYDDSNVPSILRRMQKEGQDAAKTQEIIKIKHQKDQKTMNELIDPLIAKKRATANSGYFNQVYQAFSNLNPYLQVGLIAGGLDALIYTNWNKNKKSIPTNKTNRNLKTLFHRKK